MLNIRFVKRESGVLFKGKKHLEKFQELLKLPSSGGVILLRHFDVLLPPWRGGQRPYACKPATAESCPKQIDRALTRQANERKDPNKAAGGGGQEAVCRPRPPGRDWRPGGAATDQVRRSAHWSQMIEPQRAHRPGRQLALRCSKRASTCRHPDYLHPAADKRRGRGFGGIDLGLPAYLRRQPAAGRASARLHEGCAGYTAPFHDRPGYHIIPVHDAATSSGVIFSFPPSGRCRSCIL